MRCAFLLLALFSCGHSSNWQVEYLYSDCKEHCSNKLSYIDRMSGIDLEIVCIGSNVKAYLNLYPHTIKQSAAVELVTKEVSQQFAASCLEGGQKILLSPECLTFFLQALENNQEVQITIGGYQSMIKPTEFQENFKKIQTFPKLINPVQFSF
ncbi:MAG: hypothetical protein C5B45_03130 [Chlamydiae bacterium]|nr:MAG: hypothetical protein C5B45_03130 [Chlamydiota bacterium]